MREQIRDIDHWNYLAAVSQYLGRELVRAELECGRVEPRDFRTFISGRPVDTYAECNQILRGLRFLGRCASGEAFK